MKQIALTILAVGAAALASSAAFAGPVPAVTGGDSALLHNTGGVYIDIGPPRYYGYGAYDGYYYDRPYYRSYGYYAPRRYYGYDDGYRPYKYSRRWTKERFEHPLGRR